MARITSEILFSCCWHSFWKCHHLHVFHDYEFIASKCWETTNNFPHIRFHIVESVKCKFCVAFSTKFLSTKLNSTWWMTFGRNLLAITIYAFHYLYSCFVCQFLFLSEIHKCRSYVLMLIIEFISNNWQWVHKNSWEKCS